jgi:preprotein translocase subunit SecF
MNYLFLYLAVATSFLAQGQNAVQKLNSLDHQFKELIEKSNNYKQYKVIEEKQIHILHENTNKRIEKLNEKIATLKNSVTKKDNRIVTLESKLAALNTELTDVNTEKDSLNFLGIQTSKGVYNTIVWSILAMLTFLFIFMSLRFKSSNMTTKAANKQLQTIEEELEAFRHKSIEKEQKLGRQLQDERNKLSKMKGDKF